MSVYEQNVERRERLYGDTIPDFVVHGRYSTYSNWRCRCEPCVVAWREYIAGRRKARVVDPAKAPVHGRYTTYTNWRCRCEPCVDAYRRWRGALPAGFGRCASDVTMPDPRPAPVGVVAQWFAYNSTDSMKAISAAMGCRVDGGTKHLPARRRGANGWSLSELDRITPDLVTLGLSAERVA